LSFGAGEVATTNGVDLKVNDGDKLVLDDADGVDGDSDTYLVHDAANKRVRMFVSGTEICRFKE
jgi:hypothetical protein